MIDAQDLETKALEAWGVARIKDDLPAMLAVLHFLQELRTTTPTQPLTYLAPSFLAPELKTPDLPPESPVAHIQIQERDAQVHAAQTLFQSACGAQDHRAQAYGHFPPFCEPV